MPLPQQRPEILTKANRKAIALLGRPAELLSTQDWSAGSQTLATNRAYASHAPLTKRFCTSPAQATILLHVNHSRMTSPFCASLASVTNPSYVSQTSATSPFSANQASATDLFHVNHTSATKPFCLNRVSVTDLFHVNHASATKPFYVNRVSVTDLFHVNRVSVTHPFSAKSAVEASLRSPNSQPIVQYNIQTVTALSHPHYSLRGKTNSALLESRLEKRRRTRSILSPPPPPVETPMLVYSCTFAPNLIAAPLSLQKVVSMHTNLATSVKLYVPQISTSKCSTSAYAIHSLVKRSPVARLYAATAALNSTQHRV